MITDQPCRVWWAAPVAPERAPGLVDLLDAHERDRLSRFRQPIDSARYLAAHSLTRIVLAGMLGLDAAAITFDRTCRCGKQHGKPVLADRPTPAFSMTHAGDLVGVAVHSAAVGIDVEQIRELPDLAGMAEHVCSPAELAAGIPDPGAFFTAWTRKEALLKATGDGLSTPMSTITLDARGVREWVGEGAPSAPMWLRDLRPAAGYPAAVAGFGAEPAVEERDGNPLLR
ncbi:4'-phosphopantetheinyl transferase family protein [Pseudonocardia sp. TRM90224]|uniref:4'-phosphopantetheinyl transferase family protein n=1 Tax=Pseudonocardia sp. TRM90224 TaxID=2812678 RepID=UPI001E407DFD|nr:4'-phosphopantetheinyl transferase superfamily protein [Pseudonocardia sp. TRM90224]